MLLSGFTFIRNAQMYDFPIVECIESMLPIVDELIVNVGKSEDETEKLVAAIGSPKVKLIHSVWDDSKTDRGLVLSEQTNLALEACQGRWALYLQADEALHENEHSKIRQAVERADQEEKPVEGLKFKYLHFYGGYSLVQRPWNWYPSEIRIVRKNSGAQSFGDAQTFRSDLSANHRSLCTQLIDAHVFHYGHAREPQTMARKIHYFHRFWHGDEHKIKVEQAYQLKMKDLVWYWGTHPKPYEKRVEAGKSWSLKPSLLLAQKPKSVVITCGPEQKELAAQLKVLLEQKVPEISRVVVIEGFGKWLKNYFSGGVSRKQSALIDLKAETRSSFAFLLWCWDMLSAFRIRIAHAPRGRLGKFRQKYYTVVNWGTHEKTDQGFQVPEDLHPKQILRWLGIETS
ncbi:MAG: hypothetical protein AB1540_09445 [Bdellovibrionota bacterium]